jgi:hypothetical protein
MGKHHHKSDKEKLAELFGLELPPENPYESAEEITRQAEAVLAYAKDSSYFITRNCSTCGRTFAHTLGQVAYCSDICRAAALEKIGIKWEWVVNAGKRWDYLHTEPLVIPAPAYELLQGLIPHPSTQAPTAEPQPEVEPEPEHETDQNPMDDAGMDAENEGRVGGVEAPVLDPSVIDILRSLGLE